MLSTSQVVISPSKEKPKNPARIKVYMPFIFPKNPAHFKHHYPFKKFQLRKIVVYEKMEKEEKIDWLVRRRRRRRK